MELRSVFITSFVSLATGFALNASLGSSALANDDVGNGPELIFELGAGVLVQPQFEGSDEYMLSPWPIFRPEFISIGPLQFGGGPERAFSLRPAFGIVGEREVDDVATGIDDVDTAIELGLGVSYRYGPFEAAAELRRGVTGHDGLVGEATIQAILEPTERVSVSIGPEVTFADDEYMDTYFSVSAAESVASGLDQFEASAGVKSVGVSAKSRVTVTENWSVLGRASAYQLVGDAADSPIVDDEGAATQFTAGIGAAYRFRVDFFD